MATVNDKMTAIADAIRGKTGGTEPLTLDGMAESIPEVYEFGKQAAGVIDWDFYQMDGNREDYSYAFAYVWDDTNFAPKHDMVLMDIQRSVFTHSQITDFKGILEKLGKVFDTSRATYLDAAFNLCDKMTRLPVISFEKISSVDGIAYCFNGCSSLQSVDGIAVPARVALPVTNVFNGCVSLTYLRIARGTIQADFDVSDCPLDPESFKDIITHMKKYSSTSTKVLSVKASAFAVLVAEGNTSPNENTWEEYLDDIGWNLVKKEN